MMTAAEKARGHLKHAHRCSCGFVAFGNGSSWSHENSHQRAFEWYFIPGPRGPTVRELEQAAMRLAGSYPDVARRLLDSIGAGARAFDRAARELVAHLGEHGFRWLSRTQWEKSPGGLLAKRDSELRWAANARRHWTRQVDGSEEMHRGQELEDEHRRLARQAETDAIDAGAFVLHFSDPEHDPYDYEVYATEYMARRLRPSMNWTDAKLAREKTKVSLLTASLIEGTPECALRSTLEQETKRRKWKLPRSHDDRA